MSSLIIPPGAGPGNILLIVVPVVITVIGLVAVASIVLVKKRKK